MWKEVTSLLKGENKYAQYEPNYEGRCITPHFKFVI